MKVSKDKNIFSRILFGNGKFSKNISIFTSILIVITIILFILSFYMDLIENNYSKILAVNFVILIIGVGYLNVKNSKK